MLVTVNCKVLHSGEKVPVKVCSFHTNDYDLGIMVGGGIALTFKDMAKQVSCIYESNRVNIVVYAPDTYPEPDIDDEVFDGLVSDIFVNHAGVAFSLTD